MASLIKWAKVVFRRAPSPLRFPTSEFETISPSQTLEEERFEGFKKEHYYPLNIGDVLRQKYQIIGKLGFGVTSTVWLARDLEGHRYVTSKRYTRDESNKEEFEIYKHLNNGNISHPGYNHVRTSLDRFTIPRLGNRHHCLIQKPMWESFGDLLYRNPSHRFTEYLLRAGLKQVFLALDYLHTECKLVHTDIKSINILQEIEDLSILDSFSKTEMEHPSPQKSVNDMPVYASRRFDLPRFFGLAVLKAPEVMLKAEWSYPIDIWNVSLMAWDLFEGKLLFVGDDPDGKGYSTRAHLAEVIAILGPPPLTLIRRGTRSPEFFTEDGHWRNDLEIPKDTFLHKPEGFLSGQNKEMFLEFMKGMLQWKPEDRKTAKELLQDPWLNSRSN